MIFGTLNTLPYLDEELIDVALEQVPCLLVERVANLVLLDVDEDESDVFDNCEDEMLAAIIPVLCHLLA